MIGLSLLLIGLGLLSLLSRKTLLGVITGVQLALWGGVSLVASSGNFGQSREQAAMGFLLLGQAVVLIGVAFGFGVRAYFVRQKTRLDAFRELRF